MRVAVKLAYDGRFFHGFARQPNHNTIEGTVINTCIETNLFSVPRDAEFRSASRTDKNVSSFGNVIAFNTDTFSLDIIKELNKAMNHIIFIGFTPVEPLFYPRHAKQRIYRYYLKKDEHDMETIHNISQVFIGTHDFTNFARIEPGKSPIRTIEDIQVNDQETFLFIDFFAQTYLWHQIRRIIAAILQVEKGKWTIDEIKNALEQPQKPADFGLARAEPLILYDVIYSFDIDRFIENKRIEEFKKKILQSF